MKFKRMFSKIHSPWTRQQNIPCYNFSKPYQYSSDEFIVTNSSKFKDSPFLIYKFNCFYNEWNRVKVSPSKDEEPSNLIIQLQQSGSIIQSLYYDPNIMEHHGIYNVAFDTHNHNLYAIGHDWRIWKVDLDKYPAEQSVIIQVQKTQNRMNFSSAIYSKPYLFIDEQMDNAYILTTNCGSRYRFSTTNEEINGTFPINFELFVFSNICIAYFFLVLLNFTCNCNSILKCFHVIEYFAI